MNKRYQVFVSSTFTDLENERSAVIQTLMQMDCIPAGMELFPAMDEEQFEFIKRVIDDCDYYLLMLGARYGSISEGDGLSYTEKEYRYAKEKGMKIIALIHGDPDQIPVSKTDKDPMLSEKLAAFRNEVRTGRMVKFWRSAAELPGFVALSLQQTIKTYPAVGWVRGDIITSNEALTELLALKQENEALRNDIVKLSNKPIFDIPNLAGLEHPFTINGIYYTATDHEERSYSNVLTFGQIFKMISPSIIAATFESTVKNYFEECLSPSNSVIVENGCFQVIKIQFEALGLIKLDGESGTLHWKLTPLGRKQVTEALVVRTE